MHDGGRYGLTRWLLAATQSLVLLVALVIGSHAHACPHGHHQHLSHLALGAADAGTNGGHDHGSKTSPSGMTHTVCCDFLCHGGIAILADTSQCARMAQRAIIVFPADSLLAGGGPSALDRPPKGSAVA